MGKDKVKVGVRVRPLNAREKALMPDGSLVVKVNGDTNQVVLSNLTQASNATNNNNNNVNNSSSGNSNNSTKKSFTFDHVFGMEVDQEAIFDKLGEDLLGSAFEGYNACLFAYGQTGSGKSFTMLGSADNRGVIPRLCDAIFNKIAEESANLNNGLPPPVAPAVEAASSLPPETPNVFKVEVSFMEIYNEKVRDLLVANKTSLKVREHNILGPYVDGLSLLAVKSAEDISNLMAEGNKSRTVAATNMNSESSRSHAVFTIVLTQTMTDTSSGVTGEKVSRISLVDLAGSERAAKTGAVGERLKEGSNINKSLTTLGLVISKLAEGSSGGGGGAKEDRKNFIPYRDSVLTWLLKDNLGGNSRTIMIATVSPSPDNYEETLSTLRYADRAKKIVNNAVVNEDPNAKLIRELQAEVKQLRELLKSHVSDKVLNDKLNQSEKLMRQVSETWEEKLQRSEQATQERQAALEKMGISVQQSGISVEKDRFYLVNLNADPALNELLVYYLKEDRTVVGRPDASSPPDIQLTGLGIEQLHCELVIDQQQDQTLYLIPYPKAHTCVNGERIERRRVLHHGDRILWGNHHFFRLNSPVKTAPIQQQQQQAQQQQQQSSGSTVQSGGGGGGGVPPPLALMESVSANSYELASAEFSMKQLIMSDPIHEAVAKLESKHQKDKQVALEKQRQELERQFNALMHVLSPSSPLPPGPLPWGDSHGNYLQQQQNCTTLHNSISSNQINALAGGVAGGANSSTVVAQHQNARNNKIAEGLKLLKDFLLKANQMVREANEIASAMKIKVKYRVTLLIPPNNLTPNRPKGSLVAEPSIRVEREGYYPQIWSMDKLENRLVDMREMYEEYCSQQNASAQVTARGDTRGNDKEGDEEETIIRNSSPVPQATSSSSDTPPSVELISSGGPPATFFEPDQPHVLLGIANVFLQALFYDDVTLKYAVPVINQQGEIVGRLHVEVAKISGTMDTSFSASSSKFIASANSSMNLAGGLLHQSNSSYKLDNSLYEEYEDNVGEAEEEDHDPMESKTVTVKVTVRHLAGVSSSHSVFCQYVFCDNIVVVPPTSTTSVIRFDHTRYFTIPVSDEFIDYCSESALSVEVWGHRGIQPGGAGASANQQTSQLESSSSGAGGAQQQHHQQNGSGPSSSSGETNNNSVTDRWKEVTSQVKLWVEIQELNENGEYVPVEVEYAGGAGTGGMHLLRQGLQRRILITVETSASVGQLPVVCDEIDQVSLGAITPRSTTLQRPLDSYQEEDLTLLREKWGEALKRRREYLDAHLQELANKSEKSEEEQIREKSLVSQWLTLTEERNAVLVPTPDSGVPGAPTNSSFKPESGMEQHMPIIFLDIAEDILSAESSPHSPPLVSGTTAGLNSLLPKEHDSQFVALPMHKKSYGDFYSAWSDQRMTTESWALVSWDSSVHDCPQLNKPTPPGEVIYVILRVALRLSHPVQMEVVLRKRVCLMVRKNRSSFSERLRARFTMRKVEDLDQERSKKRTGVTYQVVSHLPKSSEQLETRESLASLAVSHGENYIEEYLRSVSAVDSILNLDRMRQSVYLREEQMKSRPQKMNRSFQHQNGGVSGGTSPAGMSGFMRKTLSVPNISQLFVGGGGGGVSTSGSILGSNMKLSQLNGNPVLSPSTPVGQSSDGSVGGGMMSNGGGMPRRIKPIRSESLANLSGFARSGGGGNMQDLLSPPSNQQQQQQQQQQQSPNQARPSSLNLGNTMSGSGSTTPHSTKWTSMMTTVMEEESSGYGSQKSSEESPTTTG